jgi:hypothetical protein
MRREMLSNHPSSRQILPEALEMQWRTEFRDDENTTEFRHVPEGDRAPLSYWVPQQM